MNHTIQVDQIPDAQQKVWKSFVWCEDECFEVSTVEFDGVYETIVWETNLMLEQYDNSSIEEHIMICKSLIEKGKRWIED